MDQSNQSELIIGGIFVICANLLFSYILAISNSSASDPKYSVSKQTFLNFFIILVIEALVTVILYFVFGAKPYVMFLYGFNFVEMLVGFVLKLGSLIRH